MANAILRTGVHLPPPANAPRVFQATRSTTLIQDVLRDLLQQGIVKPYPGIKYAFRLFLVSKPSGAARPVVDISPWTEFYTPPLIRLHSGADVLGTVPHKSRTIKLDLQAGFFQIPLHPDYYRFYGLLLYQQRYAWTRLLMGHPLAPSIMQRVSLAVARVLHARFDVVMESYLDDWLLFYTTTLPVNSILRTIADIGLQVNLEKIILQPTTALVYLGLSINSSRRLIQPTQQYIRHLLFLLDIVPQASRQDLQRITGYLS
jgi:hypothetical protein